MSTKRILEALIEGKVEKDGRKGCVIDLDGVDREHRAVLHHTCSSPCDLREDVWIKMSSFSARCDDFTIW